MRVILFLACCDPDKQIVPIWNLSDRVSSGLQDSSQPISNAVFWMASACPLILKPSSPLTNPLGIVLCSSSLSWSFTFFRSPARYKYVCCIAEEDKNDDVQKSTTFPFSLLAKLYGWVKRERERERERGGWESEIAEMRARAHTHTHTLKDIVTVLLWSHFLFVDYFNETDRGPSQGIESS